VVSYVAAQKQSYPDKIPDMTPTFVLEDAACAAHGGELDYIAVIDGNNFSLEA
jgi:hypothetical protein